MLLVPDEKEREVVHRVVYDELVVGKILPESREKFARIIAELRGARRRRDHPGMHGNWTAGQTGGQPGAAV